MNKRVVWVLCFLVLALIVSAQQEQEEQWSADYVRSHPQEAFSSDPDRAVAAYPDLLLNSELAQRYFSSAARMSENNAHYYVGLLRNHPEQAVANIDVFKRALSVDSGIARQLPDVYESAIEVDISVVNDDKSLFHDYVVDKTQGQVDLDVRGDLMSYGQGRIRTDLMSCSVDQLQMLAGQGVSGFVVEEWGVLTFRGVTLRGDLETTQESQGVGISRGTMIISAEYERPLEIVADLNSNTRLLIREGRPLMLAMEQRAEIRLGYGVGAAEEDRQGNGATVRGILELNPNHPILSPLPGQEDAEFESDVWSVKVTDVTDIFLKGADFLRGAEAVSERSFISFDTANRWVRITSRENNRITADIGSFTGGPRLVDVDSRQGEVVLIDFVEGSRGELTMDGLEVTNMGGLPSFAVRVNRESPEGYFIHRRSGMVVLDQCDHVDMCREYLTAVEVKPLFRRGASDIARVREFLEREGQGVADLEATIDEGDEVDRFAAMNLLALMDTPQSREAVQRIAERVVSDLQQGTREAYVQWVAQRAAFIEAVQGIGL
ncbi:MAG TPA: hypothetical protein VJH22_03050, partial [Candidatus Nanoarchaeia archaeon]|nr:hypothetical protein [Candidatus Nanoarchaeia archaeon]